MNYFFLAVLCCMNMSFLLAQEWEPVIKLTHSDRASGDRFGYSADIDGDYSIVGATYDDQDANDQNLKSNAGSVYIFKKGDDGWVQQQKLVPPEEERIANDYFGFNVAISGDYFIASSRGRVGVGADFGAVYVFKREGEEWIYKQKLVSPVRSAENFGYNKNTIDIYGDYIVIGAARDGGNEDDSEETVTSGGGVYIFKRNGESWDLQQKILASDRSEDDAFGRVAIYEDRIIVGASRDEHDIEGENPLNYAGSAYIFRLAEGVWEQEQKIVASDRTELDFFGDAVSINGNYAVVAASYNDTDADADPDSTLINSGAAYIFYFDGETWTQQQKITAADRGDGDNFGYSLDIDGDRIVVGVPYESEDEDGNNTHINAGSIYVFRRGGTGWIQEQKLVAWDRNFDSFFGQDVSISNGLVISGAYGERLDAGGTNSLNYAGAAYIFRLVCPDIEAPIVGVNEPGTNEAICAGEAVTLVAVAEGYTINWYATEDSTEIVYTGASVILENITETTSYWAEAATEGGCASQRIEVVVTVNPLPELTVENTAIEACAGNIVLTADVEDGNLAVWYGSAEATQWIGYGEEFTIEDLEEGTYSYWVQAYNPVTHCVSERIEVVISVLPLPDLEAETAYEICSGNEAYLYAYSEGNVIFWYANETDEDYLYHGNNFITDSLTETTTYWVEAYNLTTGCSSGRTEVTVTVNPTPEAPVAVTVQQAEEGETLADLEVEAEGTLTWYADENLTVELPETTEVEDGVTYYVTQTVNGCESAATAITVEVEDLGTANVNNAEFSYYPNPVKDVLNFKGNEEVKSVRIFDLSGKLVITQAANGQVLSNVRVSTLPKGTYVVKVQTNKEVKTFKIVKQ